MTGEELRAAAIRQNDRDAAAGRCTRYVTDPAVLAVVAAMVADTQVEAVEAA